MVDTTQVEKVKELVEKAQSILVLTHEHPTADGVGSALALYLGLVNLGKKVTVACPDPITVGLSSFVGANKFLVDLPKKNFVISLDYVEGSIEKVSYNIEDSRFNLIIEPRPGFEPYTQDKVHFTYAGNDAGLVFVIDSIHLGGLKKLYEEHKEVYAGKSVVNIDRHPNNAQFGQVNIVDATAASTAELVAQVLSELGVELTPDMATNLLNAVFGATNAFQNPRVSAGAFELVAVCLRAGGKRFTPGTDRLGEGPSGRQPRVMAQPSAVQPSVNKQVTLPPDVEENEEPGPDQTQAPADWLKPKIFKSSNVE